MSSYIDPHIHMISRVTDDYHRMAQCGCVAISEPAFWAGFDRGSAEGFRDYFHHLTEVEPKRAAQFGIKHYSWLCINAKEAENVALSREVIKLIPEYLDKPNVLGIGEIGLNKNTRNEATIFQEHVDLATRTDELILIHTPHLEDTTTKCTPQRAVDIIEMVGTDRIMANSAGDWGKSDPLAVPEMILEMRRRGHAEDAIRKVVYDNPLAFFRQSKRWVEWGGEDLTQRRKDAKQSRELSEAK